MFYMNPDTADEYHILMIDVTGRESELGRTRNRRMALELRDHLIDQAKKRRERLTFGVTHPDQEEWIEWYHDDRDYQDEGGESG